MKKAIILLFFSAITFLVSSQSPDISIRTTGKICGEILEAEFINAGTTELYISIQPFYLPDLPGGQAVIVPYGLSFNLQPSERKLINLNGFTVFSDRPFPEKGLQFTRQDIEKYRLTDKTDFNDSISLYGNYIPEKFTGSRLISLDFIPTKPGTFELLGYKIDLQHQPTIASRFLLSQAKMLADGYEKLFTAGKVITHFNNDPRLEKNIMIQAALWVCSAGLEGKALKNKILSKLFRDMYIAVLHQKPEDDFLKHTDSYLRLLDRMGKEGKVFIRPEDLDRKPQCLPAVVGLSAISDNVRTPTFSKVRFAEYTVRNQAMLGPKNDCLPCILREDMKPALRNYLYQTEITKAYGNFTFLRNLLDSVALPVFVAQPLSYLDGMKNFEPRLWVAGSDKELNETLLLMYENMAYYLQNITRFTDIQELKPVNSFVSAYQTEYLNLFKFISDVFRFRESRYSFDCCELTKMPDVSYLQLSQKLEEFFKKYHKDLSIELPQYVPLVFDSQFFNDFIIKGIVLYSEKALLSFYKMLASDKQMICLESPFPTERYSALERINAFLGTNLSDIGSFAYGRLQVNLDENTALEFRFGECNCGKKRESMLPFPVIEPGSTALLTERLKQVNLQTRYEISAHAGRAYFSSDGASAFDGGGLDGFSNIPQLADSFIKIRYGEKYWFSSPDSFRFDWFSVYSLSAGYDLNKNLQVRISGFKSNGLAQAKAGFHYLSNPLDSNSEKVVSSAIFTKVNEWSVGAGARYYSGNYTRIFGGIQLAYHSFSGNIAKDYLEELEIEMKKTNGFSCFSAGIEAGARYYFNQDFFIEAAGLLSKRFVQKSFAGSGGFDKQLLIGAGARF